VDIDATPDLLLFIQQKLRIVPYRYGSLYRCMLFNSRVGVRVRFSAWLVSGYALVFMLFSVANITLSRSATHGHLAA